jgi:putative ABC transport system permease protein
MFTALQVFLVGAGLVTLFVGAVGVMNIMLVVVGERTSEIGLRKAVGATSRDVFVQFLAEAVVVGVASGLLGTGAGLLLTALAAGPLRASGMNVTGSPDPLTVGAIAFSLALVAIVAGVLPAVRAARIPPSEALRSY